MFGLRAGVLGLIFGSFLGSSSAITETVVSTSNDPMAAIDSAIAAAFEVESDGLDRIQGRQLARLSRIPDADSKSLVGYTAASLKRLPAARGGAQWKCLAQALYFEARGESVLGQFAVAEVILNRVESRSYPDTICGVVKQGTGQRHRCQFSFYCDGRAEVISEPRAYEQVGKVAEIVLNGWDRSLTDGATHYHTKAVSPGWSKVFPRTATIGYHHFYRQPVRMVRRR